MPLDFLILYGSYRRDRLGMRAALFVKSEVEKRGHKAGLIDAKEVDLPILDRMYKEYAPGTAPPALERVAEAIRGCDGVIVVAGEYNHGIQPGLKNLLDHFLEEWFYRPSGIVCYSAGMFGGVRAAMQLRMTLAELGMASIPSLYPVPRVQKTFAEDGTPADDGPYRFVKPFLDELEWYAEALKAQRAKGLPKD